MTEARVPPSTSTRVGEATRAIERGALGTGERQAAARGEELAALYRKVGDLQAELAESEQRLQRALSDSAGADEMVGQMLARIGDLEARLHATEKDLTEAQARATDLTAQAAKAKSAQAEHAERMHAAQERLAAEKQETERLRAELERAHTEIEAQKRMAVAATAVAEEARAEAARERDEAEALRDQLARERQERETLRLRVVELAQVCDERDAALARAEVLDTELETAHRERATSHEHAALAERRESETLARLEGLRRERDDLATKLDAARRDGEQAHAAPGPEGAVALQAVIEVARRALVDLEIREAAVAHARAKSLAQVRELLEKVSAADDLESTNPAPSTSALRAAPAAPAPAHTIVPRGDEPDAGPGVEVAQVDAASSEGMPSGEAESAAAPPDDPSDDLATQPPPAKRTAALAPSHDLPRMNADDEDAPDDEPTHIFADLWRELALDSAEPAGAPQRTIDKDRATKS